MIFAVDRILDVEHRRDVLAQPLAVGDGEAPIGVLGHDLQRAAILLRDFYAHEAVAQIIGHRLDDRSNALLEPGFLDVALFVQIESQSNLQDNKKSGGRSGHPLS